MPRGMQQDRTRSETVGLAEDSEERRAALEWLKAAYEHALRVGDRREADLGWIHERACESSLSDDELSALVQDVSRGKLLRAIHRLADTRRP